jgi:arylsulfatase A-like enzyme
MPTLLQLAEIDGPANAKFDGASQWPLFTNDGPVNAPDYVVHGIEGDAYYSGDWKLIAESEDEFFLFNLADDPTETNDLAAEYPDRVRDMYQRLSDYPRGPSIHHTSMLDIVLDPDTFGGEIDRAPWVEKVRDGAPPKSPTL